MAVWPAVRTCSEHVPLCKFSNACGIPRTPGGVGTTGKCVDPIKGHDPCRTALATTGFLRPALLQPFGKAA
eukprot:80088-Chlamydomonas_euryale.AAC.1